MPSKEAGSNVRNLNTEGQGRRQKNEIAIRDLVTELCPMEYNKLVGIISNEMHLAPDTVKYSFLNVLFYIGYITNDLHNIVYLKGHEPKEEQFEKDKATVENPNAPTDEKMKALSRLKSKNE